MTHEATGMDGHKGFFALATPHTEDLFDGIDPRDVLHGIWQGKYVILMAAMLFGLVAAIVVSFVTPTYISMSKVLLDPRERTIINDEQVVSDLDLSSEVVASEISILRSNVLLEEVVRDIDTARPDLMELLYPSEVPPSRIDRVLGFFGFGGEDDGPTVAPEIAAQIRLETLVWILRDVTDVWRDGDAYIISVQAETVHPQLSALIAGSIVDRYITQQLDGRREIATQATARIEARVADLRAQVEAAEAAVEDYRAASIEDHGSSIDIMSQRLLDLNEELVTARIERVAAEARYSEMERLVTTGGAEALANMVTSDSIVELNARRLELLDDDAEWAERFREDHPERRKILARLGEVERALEVETSRALAAQRNEMQIARVREATMQDALREVERQYLEASRSTIGLRQLERETEAVRSVYKELLTRVAETRTQEGFQVADARIVERATVPVVPAAPRPKLMIALGLIAGAGIGFAVVLLRRLMSRTCRDVTDLERVTGLSVISVLPEESWTSGRQALHEVETNPTGVTAEAMRAMRNHLSGGAPSALTRSIAMLSPMSGDGKTATTLLFARLAEMADEMVVVVDFDLRQDTIARDFNLGHRPGVSDVLRGGAALEDTILRDDGLGFDIITSGTAGSIAADDMRVSTVREMLEELKLSYDIVLVNCPALLQAPDGAVIAKAVDQTLLLVRHDETPRSAVRRCLSVLSAQGVTPDGVVMTRADPDEVPDGYLFCYGYA